MIKIYKKLKSFFDDNSRKIALWSIFFAVFFHFTYLLIFKNNSMIQDESRIVGDFFLQYFETQSISQKIKLIFFKENESYPGLIRILYLITYFIFGSIQFKYILILGNIINLLPIYIIYDCFKNYKLDFKYFVPIPFLVFNLASYMTFSFSYVSFFYIGSTCIPLICLYFFIYNKKIGIFYMAILCLLLSSSTVLPTLLLLIPIAFFYRKYNHLLPLCLLIFFYFGIIYFNNQSTDNQTYNYKIIMDTLNNPLKIITLFLITLGAWGIVLNIGFSFYIYLGISSLLLNLFSFYQIFKREGFSQKMIFYLSIFSFFALLLLINVVFRWGGNYEYQLNSISDGSKTYFILVYLAFLLLQIQELSPKFWLKYPLYLIGFLLVFNYFTGYYSTIGYSVLHYKNTLLSNVNRRFKSNRQYYRNQNELYKLNKLVAKGYIVDEKNPFSDNFQLIQKTISDSSNIPFKTDLHYVDNLEKGSLNMYGLRPKPTKLYSYNADLVGSFLNRTDGLYLLFISKNDTAIFPVLYNQFIYWQLLIFFPKSIYDRQYFLTLTNDVGYELAEKEYKIYTCFVENNKLTKITLTDKKLVFVDQKQILVSY